MERQAWRLLQRKLWLVMAAVLASLAASPALAQGQPRSLQAFKHTRFTADEGAPNRVSALAQTPDGYLWLAAERLTRFDGATFEPIDAPPGSRMARAEPSILFVSKSGELWVGYAQRGGVAVFRHGRLIETKFPKPPHTITGLAEGRDGAMWASWGGLGERLFRFQDGQWRSVAEDLQLTDGMIIDLQVSPDGTVWVVTVVLGSYQTSLSFLRPGARRFEKAPDTLSMANLAFDRHGRLWAADRSGARVIRDRDGQSTPAASLAYPPLTAVRLPSITFDRFGDLWGATGASGVFYAADAEQPRGGRTSFVERFRASDGLSSDVATTVLADREGNVWFGSELGLDRFRPASVVREPAIPADPMAGLRIARSKSGVVFIAAAGRLYEVASGQTPRAVMEGLDDLVAVCPAQDEGVWLVRFSGIVKVAPGVGRPSARLPPPEGGADATGCAQDGQGQLWISAKRTVMRYDAGRWRKAIDAPAGVDIWDMSADGHGDVLFTVGRQTLGRIRQGRVTMTSAETLGIGEISFLQLGREDLFIGGADGLARVRGDRIQRIETRRVSWLRSIRGLAQTGRGETWVLGGDGISRVSTAALDRALEDANGSLERRLFDVRDGVSSLSQHVGFRGDQVAAGGDGRIWFLNRAGAVRIDPATLWTNPQAPSVLIHSLSSRGVLRRDPTFLVLPPGSSAVDIAYTATSLSIPERVQFRYRLEGVDKDWIDPGARRVASYANLGPGLYRFQVIASNDAGVWNRTGATVSFRIKPTFTQSWLFKALCLLAIGLVLWLAHRVRLRAMAARIHETMAERLSERERIARELHDTLLQAVQALTLRFQLVADRLAPDASAREAFEAALDQADQVIAEGRDRVRGLQRVDHGDDLEALLLQIARRQAFDPRTRISANVEGAPRPLEPLVLDELARIANEALFNIWRHAQAKNVWIEIDYGPSFTMRFVDDGLGIPPEILTQGHRDGHFGLAGMRERARKLGGDLSLGRPPQGGAEVSVTVPGAVAYKTKTVRRWWSLSFRRPA